MIFEENKLSRHFYPTPAAAASLAPCLFVSCSEDDGRRSVNDMREDGLKSSNCGEI